MNNDIARIMDQIRAAAAPAAAKHSGVVLSTDGDDKCSEECADLYETIALGGRFDSVCPHCGQTRETIKFFDCLPEHGTTCESCR